MEQEINRHYRSVKSALRKGNLSGTFIGAKYRFSPYMACQHGCLYCDGRAEKYYVEGQFERDIVIRSNLAGVLEQELPKLREKGVISIGSGVSDAYQPVEEQEQLMRQCAAVLSRHSFPVAVLTKSALILRDLDLWSQVQERGGFMVVVSLVFTEDGLRRLFEPQASGVEQRLKILREFKARGCCTGVLAMPLIPFIADTEDHLRRLYQELAALGVDFIMPASLTLRPGRQKDTFMKLIARRFPEYLPRFRALYAEERQSGVPLLSYRRSLHARAAKIQREFGIPPLVPHYIYRGRVQLYDEINILLQHMMELYSQWGIQVEPLRRAFKGYLDWLLERKGEYNRRPSRSYAALEQELQDLIREGRLGSMIGNTKLATFLEEIAIRRKTFDYLELKAV